MLKTNLYLAAPQMSALKALQKRTGITVAEHIRRSVDAYLANLKREEKENGQTHRL